MNGIYHQSVKQSMLKSSMKLIFLFLTDDLAMIQELPPID